MRYLGSGILLAFAAGLSSMAANADFIGLYAGVDGMYSKTSVNGDAYGDDEWNAVYSVAFEHPVPFVPNAKLRFSDFSSETSQGNSLLSYNTKFDVQALDAIAYYEILDNMVSVDAGLGVKRINLDAKVSASTPLTKAILKDNADETVPAIYLAAGGKLPFTGFSAKAEAFVGKGSDTDFHDLNAEVKYNFINNIALDVGAKLGYRAMTINIDNDNSNSDDEIEVKGPYLGLEAHF